MTILDEIVKHKKKEVKEKKGLYPQKLLEKSVFFDTKPVSLTRYLLREDKSGIIAEFKRRSPSKGMINEFASVEKVTIGYMQAGASALSVLTDSTFFGGNNSDLTTARKYNYCPVLRKDFTIDEYQVIEAKSIGADAILLIAAILTKKEIEKFAQLANSLGLESILEIHGKDELEKIVDDVTVIGVNNRNLKDFTVSIETSLQLSDSIPDDFVKISESGISNTDSIVTLKKAGFKGFLIGETFMKTACPSLACSDFISNLE